MQYVMEIHPLSMTIVLAACMIGRSCLIGCGDDVVLVPEVVGAETARTWFISLVVVTVFRAC